jgi:hypothetical protein
VFFPLLAQCSTMHHSAYNLCTVHKSVAVTLIMEASLKYTDENLHALQKTTQKTQKYPLRTICAQMRWFDRKCKHAQKKSQSIDDSKIKVAFCWHSEN